MRISETFAVAAPAEGIFDSAPLLQRAMAREFRGYHRHLRENVEQQAQGSCP